MNNFAETNNDIVEGMKRAGAALATTGTTATEAFSMFTGAQEIMQNAEKVGTALKSVSMRIHGYNEESSEDAPELDESLKNITGDLIDLTKTAEHTQGVSIFKEGSTTEFKSLVDYFGEINAIWDEFTDKQKNDFLQTAFGKNQASVGASLIENYSQITKAMETMENSAGSSDREMEKIRDSITYKINALKNSWTGYIVEIADRKDIGNIVDSLTDFSKGVQDSIVPSLQLLMKTISSLMSLIGDLSSALSSIPIIGSTLLPGLVGGIAYTQKSGGGLNKQFLLS